MWLDCIWRNGFVIWRTAESCFESDHFVWRWQCNKVDRYQPSQVFDPSAAVNSSAWIHFERPQISMRTQQLWPAWFETACGSFNLFLLIISHEKTQSVFVKVSMRPVISHNHTTFCQSFQIDCSVPLVGICASQWARYLEPSLKKQTKKPKNAGPSTVELPFLNKYPRFH